MLDPEGRPIAGALVQMTWDRGQGPAAESDAAGRFALPLKGNASPWMIHVRAKGWADRLLAYAPSGRADEEREVRLARPLGVRGRVVDPAGRPLGELCVELRSQAPELVALGRQARPVGAVQLTNELGEFEWSGLNPGTKTLYVSGHEPQARFQEFDVAPGGDEIDLVFDLDATYSTVVAGAVRDAGSGRPIVDASVQLRRADGRGTGGPQKRQVDAAGAFEFGELRAGLYELSVDAEGYMDASFAPVWLGPDAERQELRLWRARLLKVRVVDERGEPVAGASVGAWDAEGTPLLARPFFNTMPASTAAPGQYMLPARSNGLLQGWPSRELTLRVRRSKGQLAGPGVSVPNGSLGTDAIELVVPDEGQLPARWVFTRLSFGQPEGSAGSLTRFESSSAKYSTVSLFDATGESLGQLELRGSTARSGEVARAEGVLLDAAGEPGHLSFSCSNELARVRIEADGYRPFEFEVPAQGPALPESVKLELL